MSCTEPNCAAPVHHTVSAFRHGCRSRAARRALSRESKARRVGIHEPRWVDNTGTVRRLQALAVMGWASKELADRLGVSNSVINQYRSGRHRANVATAAKVTALYDELAMIPGGDQRTALHAKKQKWAGPLCWDDPDNPREKPKFGEDELGRYRRVQAEQQARKRGAA